MRGFFKSVGVYGHRKKNVLELRSQNNRADSCSKIRALNSIVAFCILAIALVFSSLIGVQASNANSNAQLACPDLGFLESVYPYANVRTCTSSAPVSFPNNFYNGMEINNLLGIADAVLGTSVNNGVLATPNATCTGAGCFTNTSVGASGAVQGCDSSVGQCNISFSYVDNNNETVTASMFVAQNSTTVTNVSVSGGAFTIPSDTTPPTVSSVNRLDPLTSPTNADSLVYRVLFSEDVSNVDVTDFDPSGTTANATNISGSGQVYDVTVSGGDLASFNGSVFLAFANGLDITDTAGNPLTTPVSLTAGNNESYLLDNLPPSITSFIRQSPTDQNTNADTLIFRAEFSDTVSGVDMADFVVTGPSGVAISVSAVSTSEYDITISGGNLATYTGTIGLNFAASLTITDLLGNAMSNTEPTTDETYEKFVPTVPDAPTNLQTTYLTFNPNFWRVSWNAPANNGGSTITDYRLQIYSNNSCSGSVIGASNTGGGNYTELTVTPQLNFILNNNITSGSMHVRSINAVGNSQFSTCVPVSFDNTAPRTTSVVRQTPSSSPTNADTLTWSINFDESVQNVDASDFTLTGPTGATLNVVGSGSVYAVTASGGNLATMGGNVTLGFASGQNIEDLASNGLANVMPTGAALFSYVLENVPDAPTGTNVTTATTTSLLLRWSAANGNGQPVTRYDAILYEGATCSGSVISRNGRPDAGLAVGLSGFTPDTQFSFTVTATNSVGESEPSICQPIRTLAVQDQVITFNQPADVIYGDTATLSATASSTLGVTFSTSSATCSIVGTTLTAQSAGQCVINADQAGDVSFNPAPRVSNTINITKRPVTVTAGDQQKQYGDALVLGTSAFTIADKGVVGATTLPFGDTIDTVDLTSAGSLDSSTDADVATYIANISPSVSALNASHGLNVDNYDFTLVRGDLTINKRPITISADQQRKTYGDVLTLNNRDFSVTDRDGGSSLPNGEVIINVNTVSATGVDASRTADAATFTDEIFISSPITGANGRADNFSQSNYDITFISGDFVVNQRQITLTANQQTKEFGTSLNLDTTAFTITDFDNDTTLPNGEQVDNVTMVSQTGVAASTSAFAATYTDEIAMTTPLSGSNGFDPNNYQFLLVDGDLVIVDTSVPLAEISVGSVTSFNQSAPGFFTATVTYSEDVNSRREGDLRVTNANVSDFSLIGKNSFSLTIQPLGVGDVVLNLAANTTQDSNGNGNSAASTVTVAQIDDIAPTVFIETDTDGTFNQASPKPFVATIIFSETIEGFTLEDIVVGNGTASDLKSGGLLLASGSVFSVKITPDNQGDVTLNIAANIAQDTVGNNNTAADEVRVVRIDDVAPVISGTSDLTTTTSAGGTVTLVATVTDLGGESIDPVFSFNSSIIDSTFGFPVGVHTVEVNATDDAGNKAAPVTFTVTVTDDIAPHIISIERNTPATTDEDELSWTITFSEPVGGFDANDVEISGVTGNPNVKVTPVFQQRGSLSIDELFEIFSFVGTAHAQGTTLTDMYLVTVSGGNIANGNSVVGLEASSSFSVQDAGGNEVENGDPTGANETLITVLNDTEAPSVSILNAPTSHDRSTPFTITVEFDEDVTGFEIADITAAYASLSNFMALDGHTYTVDVTPTGAEAITLDVAADVARDAAANGNTAAPQVSIESSIVEETQQVIASFMQNRANHILSNQPDLIGFVTGANTQGGGQLGALALNATTGSQVLAFSTSRSKILAEMQRSHASAYDGTSTTNTITHGASLFESTHLEKQQVEADAQRVESLEKSYGLGGDEALTVKSGADLLSDQQQANVTNAREGGNNTDTIVASRTGSWDIWAEVYGSNSNSNSGTSDSKLWVAYLGSHYFINDHTLVGLLGQIDWADETNSVQGSRADGTGWMIGPYIAGQMLGQNLFYEARASWGQSDNDVSSIGTFTDSFNTTRWLVSGKVSGNFKHDDYVVTPSVSVSYFEETQETYTDSLNNIIPEQTISLGEVKFGPEITQNMVLEDGTRFTPKIGISGVFNFDVGNDAASQGFALGEDDFRARIDAGFSATNPENGVTISAEGFYDGIGVSDFDSYGGRLRVTVPLN